MINRSKRAYPFSSTTERGQDLAIEEVGAKDFGPGCFGGSHRSAGGNPDWWIGDWGVVREEGVVKTQLTSGGST